MHATSRIASCAGILALTVACGLSAQQPAAGAQKREARESGEHAVAAARVPAAVQNAFRNAHPNGTGARYTSETADGKTTYEVVFRDGSARGSMDITAEGVVTETEAVVPADQLPAPVRTAAEANHGRITLAEMSVAGRDTTYEITLRGRRGALKLLPNGQPKPASR
jgi:hypothetical protein